MSSDKQRAARACASCRKLKTRCYEARRPGAPCLRCEKLGAACSLASSPGLGLADGASTRVGGLADVSVNERLARLETAVSAIVNRFGIDIEDEAASNSAPSRPAMGRTYSGSLNVTGGTMAALNNSQTHPPASSERFDATNDTTAPPVYVIRDLATEMGVSPSADRGTHAGGEGQDVDLIDEGVLSSRQALALITIFHEHYGRWVFFDTFTCSEELLKEIRKSPILLSACSLIAVRHTNSELAFQLAPPLFEKSKALLSGVLLTTPQTMDFFQAALILSMWSTTIGQVPLGIDSWLLSGFALQHCLSSDLFSEVLEDGGSRSLKHHLGPLKLWNHLCLVHLHYSVGTRRKSMVGQEHIDRCQGILASDHATNFEMRMVAEVNLYWVLYEKCCLGDVDLPKAQSALQHWRQTWKLVLDQPRSQFLEMGCKFAQLLAYDQSLKVRSARVRESLLSEMVRLAAAIISLAMTTTDERTKHLSDHIYHMITFAAITLCRLLHMYEGQLAENHDIAELDTLISTLVSWLRSIGLPCHAAFTMGDIVAAFHIKLRPLARLSPIAAAEEDNAWADLSFWASFPDILGPDPTSTGNWDFLPNWEPFDVDTF